MYSNKSYRDSGAADLLAYVERDNGIENRHGEQMDSEEIQAFIDRSQRHGYEEMWEISPENGNQLSNDEMSRMTRQTMSNHLAGRTTATYCYAIHDDTDHKHVQVAVTGEKSDLWTDQEDLDQFEEIAIERFQERDYQREQQRRHQLQIEQPDQTQQHDRDHNQGRGRGYSRGLLFVPVVPLQQLQNTSDLIVLGAGIIALVFIWLINRSMYNPLQRGLRRVSGGYGFLVAPILVLALAGVLWTQINPLLGAFLVGLYSLYTIKRLFDRWRRRSKDSKALDSGQYVVPGRFHQGTLQPWFLPNKFTLERRSVSLRMDESVAALGATSSGKTNTIKILAHQMTPSTTDPKVVFDYKGEWSEFYQQGDEPVHVLAFSGSTVQWNVFHEIEREDDFREIAEALFPLQQGDTPFFVNGVREVFAAVCIYLLRRAQDNDSYPTNRDLIEFTQQDRETVHDALDEYPDLSAARAALDPDAERQASGVWATFQLRVQKLFDREFAADGAFSIREYMQNPNGHTLILRYQPEYAESVKPVFRFFLDWSARFALANPDSRSHFILDEFARVPKLTKIGDLVNVGRGQNTQTILGIQSVAQLNDTYGNDAATAILSGTQGVFHRLGDPRSEDYARSQIPREEVIEQVPDYDYAGEVSGTREKSHREHPLIEGEMGDFSPGEAVIVRDDGWIRGQIDLYERAIPRLNRALESVGLSADQQPGKSDARSEPVSGPTTPGDSD